jgi:hypothetical protein
MPAQTKTQCSRFELGAWTARYARVAPPHQMLLLHSTDLATSPALTSHVLSCKSWPPVRSRRRVLTPGKLVGKVGNATATCHSNAGEEYARKHSVIA